MQQLQSWRLGSCRIEPRRSSQPEPLKTDFHWLWLPKSCKKSSVLQTHSRNIRIDWFFARRRIFWKQKDSRKDQKVWEGLEISLLNDRLSIRNLLLPHDVYDGFHPDKVCRHHSQIFTSVFELLRILSVFIYAFHRPEWQLCSDLHCLSMLWPHTSNRRIFM